MFKNLFQLKNLAFAIIVSVSLTGGCAVEAAKEKESAAASGNRSEMTTVVKESEIQPSKKMIVITPNSPADTVRAFYENLRERKFREAMFLTNLRPAIEGLTDAELKDLQVDFEPLAAQIPAEIEINGEITSQNNATVTAKLPDNETDEMKIQAIRLRQENRAWTILTVDETAEAEVKKEGKNYFFALRLKTHHEEAKAMLERVNKAEMIYALQNKGLYGDTAALVGKGFLPQDVASADSTGYIYQIQLSADRKKYTATATPAVYGKTGKLSFGFASDSQKTTALKSADAKGQALKM